MYMFFRERLHYGNLISFSRRNWNCIRVERLNKNGIRKKKQLSKTNNESTKANRGSYFENFTILLMKYICCRVREAGPGRAASMIRESETYEVDNYEKYFMVGEFALFCYVWYIILIFASPSSSSRIYEVSLNFLELVWEFLSLARLLILLYQWKREYIFYIFLDCVFSTYSRMDDFLSKDDTYFQILS